MLPKKYRIPKDDLIRVIHEGKRYPTPNFTLTIARNNGTESRFAVRIGVSVHKRAVIRNHMKRLYHESMAMLLPTLKDHIDILCSIKVAPPTETREHVATMLEQALKKIA